MKYLVFFIGSIFMLMAFNSSEIMKDEKVFPEVIYPKIRIWTSPSKGEEPTFNSSSFQWPSKKKATYSFRLSTSKDFNRDLIQKNEIQFAIFNPHKTLKTGKWYWQYKVDTGNWNPVDSFVITDSTPRFEPPEIEKLLSAIPETDPRVLSRKTDLGDRRERANKYNASVIMINEANKYLNQPPPKE